MPPDASAAVLHAARAAFASRGYAVTTVKSVAAAAGVAPAVVKSLYANKERLFTAAMRLPFDPADAVPELLAPGLEGMGERLVRLTLALVSDDAVRRDLVRVLRSDAAAGAAIDGSAVDQVRAMTEFMSASVLDRVVAALGVPDARLRGSVISSYLMGIVMSRYVVKMEPLASASDDEIVAMVAPAIQALLDPTVNRKGRT
ncbi:MAG: TetR family transcriptional regulator [Actinomycetes bacterium]